MLEKSNTANYRVTFLNRQWTLFGSSLGMHRIGRVYLTVAVGRSAVLNLEYSCTDVQELIIHEMDFIRGSRY